MGKSHLAAALGVKAIKNGFSVAHFVLDDLMHVRPLREGPIVLTSNKHVRDWLEIFAGDEILTTAILDRLLHHVVVIHIDGRSYRLRELDALLKPGGPSASPSTSKGGSPKP